MRSIRHIALSAVLILSAFCAVLYSSCSKSTCTDVTCLNGGKCSAGICAQCPKGIGGNNCETIYRDNYVLKPYTGNVVYTSSIPGDTLFVGHADSNNTLSFNAIQDSTDYTKVQVTWTRPGQNSVSVSTVLTNNSNAGSTFSFPATTVDTFTYSGTGSVSAASASVNLVEMHPNSPSVIVTLSNFTKK